MQLLSLATLLASFLFGTRADEVVAPPVQAPVQEVPEAGPPGAAGEDGDPEGGDEARGSRPMGWLPFRGDGLPSRAARRSGGREPERRSEALETKERVLPFTPGHDAAKASRPRPRDGGHAPRRGAVLSWTPGKDAVSHDVWFGPSAERLVLQGNLLEAAFELPELGRRARYVWRVDEVDARGRRTVGDVWAFRTSRS